MPRRVLFYCLLGAVVSAFAQSPTHSDIRDELLRMSDAEQVLRKQSPIDEAKLRMVDTANQARLKEIIATHGIPTIQMVGEAGTQAAWLIVQHADNDRDFQLIFLNGITELAKRGSFSFEHVAYLYDRTHVPQRFGTQGRCRPSGDWEPSPVDDIEHLDVLRA